MQKIIKNIRLDAFDTTIIKTGDHRDSPYRYLINDLCGNVRDNHMTELRHMILTEKMDFDDLAGRIQEMNLFHENDHDISDSIAEAKLIMEAELESAYKRNPELDELKIWIDENKLDFGIISDLGLPYAAVADKYLGDIPSRVYSFENAGTKEDGKPYRDMIDDGYAAAETVMAGDNFESDFMIPKKMGFVAFWRVGKMPKNTLLLKEYRDDIITNLNDIPKKLAERGYRLG